MRALPLLLGFVAACSAGGASPPSPTAPAIPTAQPETAEPVLAPARPDPTDPWATPAGRIGRLRVIEGVVVAVFGASDPRFVGRLTIQDNYADNWLESKLVPAGDRHAPAVVHGLPIDPARAPFELRLGDAIEVHDIYVRALGHPSDELAARGFRVTGCGRDGVWESQTWRTCGEGDLVVVGPLTRLAPPTPPTQAATDEVRRIYERARKSSAGALRSIALHAQLGLHWVMEHDGGDGSLVWTRASSERGGFVYRVHPRDLLVAGDALLVTSLDEAHDRTKPRYVRVHQFRLGREPIEYAISPNR